MKEEILITNNLIEVSPSINSGINTASPSSPSTVAVQDNTQALGTIISNLSYYGFAPSSELLATLSSLTPQELTDFWLSNEAAFKNITGENREMDKFVVYKNFPKEVLDMNAAQYWLAQVAMYLGLPNKYVTQKETARPAFSDKVKYKVLAPAKADSIAKIEKSLFAMSTRWNDRQTQQAVFLIGMKLTPSVDFALFSFKENAIMAVQEALKLNPGLKVVIPNATDVLRLGAGISGGDVALKEATKFKFKRSERRMLINLLESSKNLLEDAGLRPELWKKFLHNLHPGDYTCPTVQSTYDALYKNATTTFNAKVEKLLTESDDKALNLLASRPGEFFRRFYQLYAKFDSRAITALESVAENFSNLQLVKLEKYVSTINNRSNSTYAPKGNWGKLQIVENKKSFKPDDIKAIKKVISNILAARLQVSFPQGVDLDPRLDVVKLPTNDQRLADYGRGTQFEIPENIKFFRSASFWAQPGGGNTWFDNGWNFFDSNWASNGVLSWDKPNAFNGAAVFSGDPTNSKDLKGKGCQMIDLYIDKLLASGVRYCVWSVLAYSSIKFDDAVEVFGTLQMGEKPETGKLFEPSRAQMSFPLKGQGLVKYIAYVDLVTRRLVYMDASLKSRVSSASSNGTELSKVMPSFVEYLDSLPSIKDLLQHAPLGTTPVLSTDSGYSIEKGSKAYVFKRENQANEFDSITLTDMIGGEEVFDQGDTANDELVLNEVLNTNEALGLEVNDVVIENVDLGQSSKPVKFKK